MYTIYSILFIVFCILIVVTAFITVALTYFQLASEDHRWWWRSFLCGGSTGGWAAGAGQPRSCACGTQGIPHAWGRVLTEGEPAVLLIAYPLLNPRPRLRSQASSSMPTASTTTTRAPT